MTIATFDRASIQEALLEGLPDLVAEVRDRLVEHWPDYAAFLDTDRDAVVKPAALFPLIPNMPAMGVWLRSPRYVCGQVMPCCLANVSEPRPAESRLHPIITSFPAVTCSMQATLLSGKSPGEVSQSSLEI